MIIWLATQKRDAECYNLIAKSKKDLVKRLENYDPGEYREAWKLDIDCTDIFNLVSYLTSEGGGRHKYIGERLNHYEIKLDLSFRSIPLDTHWDSYEGKIVEDLK